MSIYSTQLLRTSAIHRGSITGVLDVLWNRTSEAVANLTSASFPRLAQALVVSTLKELKHGELRVVTATETMCFGSHQSCDLKAEIRVKSPTFWTRILFSQDLGFAEAFMYGDVDCDDVSALLRLFIANKQHAKSKTLVNTMLSAPKFLTAVRFLGDITNSRANISAHYDIGNTMFTAFLSSDMNYSSAIFKDFTEDIEPKEGPRESLADAQIRKMRNIIRSANIQKGHHVLEIGTGWGALAIMAAEMTGCTVDTLTLSSEQQALAEARIKFAGLSDKITVHLMDYRDVKSRPEWEHSFDRFMSVEMMEHVGKDFFETYWEVVDWALKEDGAVGCVQVITLPESRVKLYDRDLDFVRKWSELYFCFLPVALIMQFCFHVVFPGGYLPSCNLLISSMANGSCGRLITDSVSNIGPHYARTLREWKCNFIRNFQSIIAPALHREHDLSPKDMEIFRRKWIYYFDYCEAGFVTKILGDHIISFTREGNVALGCTWDDYDKF
ncbi:cyclopropane-fatty-acyl-phospholipid synthase [Hysterangium stoloniferum]|nr:cyclopropane-fatty-acyl-phospholipid synthase [Hysterangium stoloniferum]